MSSPDPRYSKSESVLYNINLGPFPCPDPNTASVITPLSYQTEMIGLDDHLWVCPRQETSPRIRFSHLHPACRSGACNHPLSVGTHRSLFELQREIRYYLDVSKKFDFIYSKQTEQANKFYFCSKISFGHYLHRAKAKRIR